MWSSYDPPHIPNQGRDNKKDFNTRFGLVLRSSKENHYTFTHTFPPFVREAYRVLKKKGFCSARSRTTYTITVTSGRTSSL